MTVAVRARGGACTAVERAGVGESTDICACALLTWGTFRPPSSIFVISKRCFEGKGFVIEHVRYKLEVLIGLFSISFGNGGRSIWRQRRLSVGLCITMPPSKGSPPLVMGIQPAVMGGRACHGPAPCQLVALPRA